MVGLREWSYALGDLDRLDWALNLACSTEDAVSFARGVCLPTVEKCFAAVVGSPLVNLLLLSRDVQFVKNVDGAYRNANSVCDADVKIYGYCDAVYAVLLTYAILPFDFVPFVFFFFSPLVWIGGIVDYFSLGH